MPRWLYGKQQQRVYSGKLTGVHGVDWLVDHDGAAGPRGTVQLPVRRRGNSYEKSSGFHNVC